MQEHIVGNAKTVGSAKTQTVLTYKEYDLAGIYVCLDWLLHTSQLIEFLSKHLIQGTSSELFIELDVENLGIDEHTAEQWRELISQLQERDIKLNLVVVDVQLMSEAADVIDKLVMMGLYRGMPNLTLLYSASTAASALFSTRLISYFDGVVVDVSKLTCSAFSSETVSDVMLESEAVNHLVEVCLNVCQQQQKLALLKSELQHFAVLRDTMHEKPYASYWVVPAG